MTTEFKAPDSEFAATLRCTNVGRDRLRVWQVADLERHVDREALLRAVNPAEPPYWAHLWSGARVLAAAVPRGAGRTLELGCGLGLPSLVAARRGGTVLATDREAGPLAFVRASAMANELTNVDVAVLDFVRPAFSTRFDTILAAEVLYDRGDFRGLADAFDAMIAPRGTILLTDGERIDTAEFYALLDARGFERTAAYLVVEDQGWRERVRLVRIRRS